MWNSLNGYVMIQVNGFSLEKLLNRMLQSDIPVWNICRQGATGMTLEIKAKDFIHLRRLKKGIRCKLHIIDRRGMPFVLARFRFRKVLAGGLLLGGLLLFVAQTRVWAIQIEGLYEVPETVVEQALASQGIKLGMPRAKVEPASLSEAVNAYDGRIAWAGAHLDGVALKVQIVEADTIPPLPDKSKPVDIVATKDSIIRSVTALNGKPCVADGDAVRAGDTLIRGDITREGAAERMLVHAEGEVQAEVYYTTEITLPGTKVILGRSGNAEPYRALAIAGFPVYHSKVKYAFYEEVSDADAGMRGLVLPIRYQSGLCYELVEQKVPADREEVLAEALFLAELEVLWNVPKDARILNKDSEAHWNQNGTLTATATVSTLEQIGAISYILNGA